MSRFLKKLNALLNAAAAEKIVDEQSAARLREMAKAQEQSGGVLSLASVLGGLGAMIMSLGVVVLVAANWADISNLTKLLIFFMLFGTTHGAGIYLRHRSEMIRFPEALNILGAGLLLAGLALISQIYQFNVQAKTLILFWFLGIAPLSWCFRSAPIAMMSIAALVSFFHLEQFSWISNRNGQHFSFVSVIIIDVGFGTALIGGAAWLRDRESQIALAFRVSGVMLLFWGVYMMGFYRHFSPERPAGIELWIPGMAVLLGAIGLATGFRSMLPDHPFLRNRLVTLLSLLLATAALMLLADGGVISKGPNLKFFNFGWYRTFHVMEWVLSVFAWVLWFSLTLWCVFFASRTGRRGYLNAGVIGVGLGVVTRFFDLMGGLNETGLVFFFGGLVLLVTCFAVEFWRRKIVRRLVAEEKNQSGARP